MFMVCGGRGCNVEGVRVGDGDGGWRVRGWRGRWCV